MTHASCGPENSGNGLTSGLVSWIDKMLVYSYTVHYGVRASRDLLLGTQLGSSDVLTCGQWQASAARRINVRILTLPQPGLHDQKSIHSHTSFTNAGR